jgi:predicted transcriptional regulator
MRRLLFTAGILFVLLLLSNLLAVISESGGVTYFEEDFESGYDGWKHTNGIVFIPRTQSFVKTDKRGHAFRMTGLVEKDGKAYGAYCGRFEHTIDVPVLPNTTFDFAYRFFFKNAMYVGYEIEYSDGKLGSYFSLFSGWFVNISTAYIVQYPAEVNQWWHKHSARVYYDYLRAFGSVPKGLRITSIALVMADNYHNNPDQKFYPRRTQTAFFDSIKMYEDPTNYPPDVPTRFAGSIFGNVNTSYLYSITASDINYDQVRIYCECENNSGTWSEWMDSGGFAVFKFRWTSPGKYKIRARTQDKFLLNSTWSEPLVVNIADEENPLTVLIPNGGERWFLGRNYTITWAATDISGDLVKIELINDQIKRTIVEYTPNNGNFSWQIPTDLPPGLDYMIKISSVDQPFLYDFSDSSFALDPYLDVLIDSRYIDTTDWTPMINDTVTFIAQVRYTGTKPIEPIPVLVNFSIVQDNQTTPSQDYLGPFSMTLTKPLTTIEASWHPTRLGDYYLTVEINTEKDEFSKENNKAVVTKKIRVGATDDDLVLIPPIETIRIRDGTTMLVPIRVICYKNDLKNVLISIIESDDLDDFTINISTPYQDLTAENPQEFYLSITPLALPKNLSSVQKEIIVKALGYSNSTGDEWTSEAGYIILEVYRPTSLIVEVAVVSLLLGGILTFFSVIVTETGKYKIFSLLSLLIPLFTHIHSEEVLENFVRGQIYGFIKTNPGSHYNNIKKSLDIGNGTLAHHLSMLEKTGLIKSRQEGLRYRLFYPTEMTFPEVRRYMLSEFQLMLLQFIRDKPGISQKEIVGMQQESQQTVSYNLKELEKVREIVSMKKHGKKFYYLVPKKQASPL